jgi:hypothetical protein
MLAAGYNELALMIALPVNHWPGTTVDFLDAELQISGAPAPGLSHDEIVTTKTVPVGPISTEGGLPGSCAVTPELTVVQRLWPANLRASTQRKCSRSRPFATYVVYRSPFLVLTSLVTRSA